MTTSTNTIGRCKTCGKTHSRTLFWSDKIDDWGSRDGVWLPPMVCCNRNIEERTVRGSTNHTKCDAKCWNGKGHSCSCSCGGLNHGRSYRTCSCGPQMIRKDDGLCGMCGNPCALDN